MSASILNLIPPFTRESAILKVRKAEDGWNSRNPEQVSLAYTPDSVWRNRSEFINGREEIVSFLMRKWQRELDYRLIKELWAFDCDRIAVRFAYGSMMIRGDGFVRMETRTGSLTLKGSCITDMQASTMCRLMRLIVCSTGPRAGVPMTTRD
jgi:nuclear transport factor 2 (NTF2) superfamily protein